MTAVMLCVDFVLVILRCDVIDWRSERRSWDMPLRLHIVKAIDGRLSVDGLPEFRLWCILRLCQRLLKSLV